MDSINCNRCDNITVETYRGNLIENFHRGNIAVINKKNELIYSFGDCYKTFHCRSAIKLLQALSAVESGAVDEYGLTEEELAQLTASHTGETYHISLIKSILDKAGIPYSKLQTHENYYRNLNNPFPDYTEQFKNCCSGKHAAILITAKKIGADLETYLKIENPVQQLILKDISEITETDIDKIHLAEDGCGAPVHGIPLISLAKGIGKAVHGYGLAENRAKALRRILDACIKYPYAVGGEDSICTEIMRASYNTIYAKVGALGIYVVADTKTEMTIACKTEDGNPEANRVAVLEAMWQTGMVDDVFMKMLEKHAKLEVRNSHNRIIGHSVPVFSLIKHSKSKGDFK